MMNTQYTLFGEDFSFNVETSTIQVNNISKYQFNQDSYLCESTWCAICGWQHFSFQTQLVLKNSSWVLAGGHTGWWLVEGQWTPESGCGVRTMNGINMIYGQHLNISLT